VGGFYEKMYVGSALVAVPANSTSWWDPYIAKLSQSGALDWIHMPRCTYTGGSSITMDKKGNVFWSGVGQKLLLGNDSIETSGIEQKLFVTKMTDSLAHLLTDVRKIAADAGKLFIYPNPSSGAFTVDLLPGNFGLMIYDYTGICIYKAPHCEEKTLTPALQPGIYFVEINDGKTKKKTKLVIR
jgi:hypothetical protein